MRAVAGREGIEPSSRDLETRSSPRRRPSETFASWNARPGRTLSKSQT